MSNTYSQAIQVQVQLPDEAMRQFEQALTNLRILAQEFPQLREGLALRALRELWPPASHQMLDDRIQMSLTLAPTVHALQSVGADNLHAACSNNEVPDIVPVWNSPINCKAKMVEGEVLCDDCATKFPNLELFRCMK